VSPCGPEDFPALPPLKTRKSLENRALRAPYVGQLDAIASKGVRKVLDPSK